MLWLFVDNQQNLHLYVSAVLSIEHNILWLIDIRLNWLAVVSTPLTSARDAAKDYHTDCISIFNGKLEHPKFFLASSCRVFCAISDPQKDKLVALPFGQCSFIICDNIVACMCALLKLIMLYSTPFWEDDAFLQPHKSFDSRWQLLMSLCDEVPLNQLGLLDSVGHAVRHDPTVCDLMACCSLPSQLWTIRPR